ncbi:MAG: response regulator [Leptospiraceae bacterium]|nr:response regulator [Leptospiraceae bacterium]
MKIEILIIDDSLEIGAALQMIIENLGYTSKYFDSSEKAIPYFRNELNPVIFLDIFLPNENGLDLLPTIKDINPFTQVIMMSGEGDIQSVVSSLKNKASDFLLKPFSIESVKIAIERGIEYHTLLKNNFNYQETLERDMKFISSIQKQVISPKINTDQVYADFHAYSFVSGSFYYSQEIDNNTIIIFGEIEGNGVTSSFIGLLTICLLKDIIKKETTPDRVLSLLNDELYFKINIHTLTAICLYLDKKNHVIRYSNGGGANPIILSKNQTQVQYLDSEVSNIIGVMPGTEFILKEKKIEDDSILLLYNSGFLPIESNSTQGFKNFVLGFQEMYTREGDFENLKKYIDSYIRENLKNNPERNHSFMLHKF